MSGCYSETAGVDCFSRRIPEVAIIHRRDHLLSRQVDSDAGEMVLRQIQAMGVEVLTNCSPVELLTRPAEDDPEQEVFVGFKLPDGGTIEACLVIYAIGIKPRDDIARASGIECDPRGGIVVGDDLQTMAKDVYAIGECASWKSNTYGLIGPGSAFLEFFSFQRATIDQWLVEMADILSFNLTQTDSHAPRVMNAPDLSTKLKYTSFPWSFPAVDYFSSQADGHRCRFIRRFLCRCEIDRRSDRSRFSC